MDLVVLLPTANRPDLLRTALASVARQACLDRVVQVVVSENGRNRDSERTCREFPGLPITYLFHDPPLTAQQHGCRLFSVPTSASHAAILCDDDWWGAGHLQESARALTENPGTVAAFSACWFVGSELANDGRRYFPAPLMAAGPWESVGWWRLTAEQVLASAWLQTPFHYSFMVIRTEVLREAALRYHADIHPNYSDRLMASAFALNGDVMFDPQAHGCVRFHSGNWHVGKASRMRRAADAEGRDRIAALARGRGVDVVGYWRSRLPQVPAQLRNDLANVFFSALGPELIRQHGFAPLLYPTAQQRALKWLDNYVARWVKPLLPPVILDSYRRIRDGSLRRPSAGRGGNHGS